MVKKSSKKFNNTNLSDAEEVEETTYKPLETEEVIIKMLNSTDIKDREYITSVLSSYEFSENDQSIRQTASNPVFLESLSEKILDSSVQVRFNSLQAIINLILVFNDQDVDIQFIQKSNLVNRTNQLLKEYLESLQKQITNDPINIERLNKTIKIALDLFLLLLDIYDDDRGYNQISFYETLNCATFIITNIGLFKEDIVTRSCKLITQIVSITPIKVNENDYMMNFIKFGENLLTSTQPVNSLITSSILNSFFYLGCVNNFSDEILVRIITKILENSVSSIGEEVSLFNKAVQSFFHNMDKENSNEDENDTKSHEIRTQVKVLEDNVNSLILYLKSINDIVSCSDEIKNEIIPNSVENSEDMEEEIEEEMENDKTELESIISNKLLELKSKGFNVLQSVDNNYLLRIYQILCNDSIEQFLLSDFDKIIVVKELLIDLEYSALSILNSLLISSTKNLDDTFVAHIFKVVSSKLFKIEFNDDEKFTDLILSFIRSFLKIYSKSLNSIEIDYFNVKELLLIMKKYSKNKMIRIYVIDIIAFLYANLNHSEETNREICKILLDFIYNEQDIEVISHVVNAYFDIYSEDHYNHILKESNLISLMESGINDFRGRIKAAFNNQALDRNAYSYCMETLTNLKRFIKYKNNMFLTQNL